MNFSERYQRWREKWYEIIFDSHTPAGKAFDLAVLILIVASLLVVMFETVPTIRQNFYESFRIAEWLFTILFTIEYILRIIVTDRRRQYIFSFYGLVDLLSILPTYLAVLLPGAQYFLVLRSFRLLRVFRILKLVRFLGEAKVLTTALRNSRVKITVFIITVLCVVFIMGAVMYLVEGPQNGFTSIPVSIYWSIVTLTTVGYGDISPQTPLGQIIASLLMIIGYGIIAVPTGIVTAEISRGQAETDAKKVCPSCGSFPNAPDANYCKRCGSKL